MHPSIVSRTRGRLNRRAKQRYIEEKTHWFVHDQPAIRFGVHAVSFPPFFICNTSERSSSGALLHAEFLLGMVLKLRAGYAVPLLAFHHFASILHFISSKAKADIMVQRRGRLTMTETRVPGQLFMHSDLIQ